jgi:aminoglycoside phosphotransferase (APT) family kinase protein
MRQLFLRFIAARTNIPVPKLYSCFEDDKAVYLVMEYVEGVTMASLNAEQRQTVETELWGYVQTLRNLKSTT